MTKEIKGSKEFKLTPEVFGIYELPEGSLPGQRISKFPIESHSYMHSNIALWKKYITPKLKK